MRIRPITIACTFLLAACGSNINVRTASVPNFSLAGRSTFRLLPVPRRSDNAPLDQNDPMLTNSITNHALRDDIRRALESRGYRPADGGPADFDIAVYAAAREVLDVRTYNYGYTWRGWPRQYTEVTPYQRGTVLINLIDPATHQLLWRGQGVAAVSDDPNEYIGQLGKVVKAIVKKLPVAGSQ